MDARIATVLNRRLLANLRAGTTDTAAGEVRIPGQVFHDETLFRREQQCLFRDTPQPVAFSGELPDPGSFLALEVVGVPIILSRDGAGRLHALVNACAHRGARVVEGAGQAPSLVCAFHGWAYHADGRLRGRPGKEYFDADCDSLELLSLPVSEKYGIVVVGTHGGVSQQAVDSALDEVGDELAGFDFASYRQLDRRILPVRANWKLVNDLSLESYHFVTLHRDSVAEMLAPNAVVDTYLRCSRWAFPMKTIDRLSELAETDWPETVQGSVTYTLYPGVMLLVNALGAQMIRAEPGMAPGQCEVSYTGMVRPGCDEDAARQAYDFGGAVFRDEDLPVAEACQSGIEARGGDYPLGANEPLLQFWHRLWAEAVAD